MADLERLTVTLLPEAAASVREAVAAGEYASAEAVVRAALQDWTAKRASARAERDALKADIAVGLADLEAGRVRDFDIDRIVERGRQRSAGR